jgi:hypothetical protein
MNGLNALEELAGRGSRLHKQHRVYLRYAAVATMPEEYESRLEEMFPGRFKNLKMMAPTHTTLCSPN